MLFSFKKIFVKILLQEMFPEAGGLAVLYVKSTFGLIKSRLSSSMCLI